MGVDLGKLEKLYIVPYRSNDYSILNIAGPPFYALFNPETYTYKYRIEYDDTQAPGTSSVSLKFNRITPQEFNFDFLFDGTGAVPGMLPVNLTVNEQLELFRLSILYYQGDVHRPYNLKIHWGTLLFKGLLTSMDIEFKLFAPDGSPLRAIARCAFKGSIEETLRLLIENRMSPDITHEKVMKGGDRLSLMASQVYNDQRYYIPVARFNRMDGFRKPQPGRNISLPAIDKS